MVLIREAAPKQAPRRELTRGTREKRKGTENVEKGIARHVTPRLRMMSGQGGNAIG